MRVPRRQASARGILLFLLGSIAVADSAAASIGNQLTTTDKLLLQREVRLVVDLLQNHHYSGRAFREITNKEMVTRFLEELDPGADFLTSEDNEYLTRRFDRTLKSVYLFRGDLQPAFEIFDLFATRAQERLAWVARRLTRDFDLTVEEAYPVSRRPAATPAGTSADQRWEQHLKNQVLQELLAGRPPDEARAAVAKRYAQLGRQIETVDPFAIRERFLDAIIRSFDPHSGYFSADSTREFAVDMENAVIGLGLDLRKKDGRCEVAAVQVGGPADLFSSIRPGDTLVALADADGPWQDAASLRLRELAAIVRGEPGRPVRLAYRPEGSDLRTEVTLTRTRVVLAADRAHGAVSDVPDPGARLRRIGWIVLPSFYAGGTGEQQTSAAADIRELLRQMGDQQIEGLVLDLRANPGGALTEAAAICQLFLPKGNMMLSRGPAAGTKEHPLREEPPAYTGPLVVLTSAQSASASEILAGAMRFHRRAVVVGGASTYGKGTAQNYIPLAKLPGINPKDARDWGTLRLTMERFYLPDGTAVQRAGVPSHITLPDFDPPGLEREADLPHALETAAITPPTPPARPASQDAAAPDELVQHLNEVASRDCQALPEWDLWRQERQYQRTESERTSLSLQLISRQRERDDLLERHRALQQTRRALTAGSAFPTRSLEIAAVQAARAAHEEKLRGAAEPRLHRLHQGGFFVETDQGRLREIRLSQIRATAFLGDAADLAAAFGTAAGAPLAPAEARRILEQLSLLDPLTDRALLAAVQRVTEGRLSADAGRAGTEALLKRLTELDNEMRRERAGLDIPLREGQRLAAAWAAWPQAPRTP